MSSRLTLTPLGMPPWPTQDPFLFCVHHDDRYPRGNGHYGPDAPLAGRQIGSDFSGRDGWSMYHGQQVPGFPAHPHRGFETVTVVRQGRIDHSDSLGAAARYGGGDTQWLTTGAGVVHAEMFPLLSTTQGNPTELFQIWLNLPARAKFAPPHFTMFWAEQIPRLLAPGVTVTVVAGALPGASGAPLPPPPDSWAAQPEADVAIWTVRLAPDARWTLPAACGPRTLRRLYFFAGQALEIDGQAIAPGVAIDPPAGEALALHNPGAAELELLMLQGAPIGESVAQYGPFVMNTRAELQQAFADYQRTQFGGWPWPDEAPVHGPDPARFARHADGQVEHPPGAAKGG
ncbi:pirin family protein [Ideonella livida]|uniref:Pirin family protein n=1 Tax=Ideonella livida TaxID=2707176 RepID=A0A7C9TKS8_9BURK|nr:pirin family protein [Ideonella livida]NDY92082.1 pirin family protein [Ideonella livida]